MPELKPITEDMIYLREIANVQSSLAKLLEDISKTIEVLPDDRDYRDAITILNDIKSNISKILTNLNNQANDIKTYNNDYIITLKEISEKVDGLYSIFEESGHFGNKVKEHRQKLSDIHALVCSGDNIDIITCINNLSKLIKDINQMLHNLEIKYGDESVTWNDIQLVVEMARRSDKRYKFWNIRKKALAWAFGGIFALIMFFDNIVAIISVIIRWVSN
jgi:DNA repair ATPase RecN